MTSKARNAAHLRVFSGECSRESESFSLFHHAFPCHCWRVSARTSHGECNGSGNVLTLLGVKMTERDTRQRSHRGPPPHYYHSIGSPEEANGMHHKAPGSPA